MKGYISFGVLSLIAVISFIVVDAQNAVMNNELASKTEAAGQVEQLALNQISKNTPAIELVKPISIRSQPTAYSNHLRELHRAFDIPYFTFHSENSKPLTNERIDAVLANQYRSHFMRYTNNSKLIGLAKELRINSSVIEGFQYFHKQQQLIDSTSQGSLKRDSTVQSINANGRSLSNDARLSSDSEGIKRTEFYNKNRLVNAIVMALLGQRSLRKYEDF